ncbi:hypothetical protein [Acinetobacter sp. YH18001]|uniref:hypothetical protein n=1 Tax=Acinetobacter sp. YH18001 TaxID=2601197 RepID=UPI0015D18676|nr:hypothetical protein [Acinetobacter sp. YH18001]
MSYKLKTTWYSLIRAIESKNGGGIRKAPCAQGNNGKSGGIRVIYKAYKIA